MITYLHLPLMFRYLPWLCSHIYIFHLCSDIYPGDVHISTLPMFSDVHPAYVQIATSSAPLQRQKVCHPWMEMACHKVVISRMQGNTVSHPYTKLTLSGPFSDGFFKKQNTPRYPPSSCPDAHPAQVQISTPDYFQISILSVSEELSQVLEVVLASDWDRSRQVLGYNHKVSWDTPTVQYRQNPK